jgi:ComF family protein
MKLWSSVYKKIIQTIFPTSCLECGASGSLLCPFCLVKKDFYLREKGELGVTSLFSYKDKSIQKLLWLLKYKHGTKIAEIFSLSLYEAAQEISQENFLKYGTPHLVVLPIPIHKNKKRKRGYNQSEILCEALLKIQTEEVFLTLVKNVLVKTKDTPSQTKQRNKKGRVENIKNSFAVMDTESIEGKHILLIDDIMTTGATIEEAKRTLLRHGTRSVSALTVAH